MRPAPTMQPTPNQALPDGVTLASGHGDAQSRDEDGGQARAETSGRFWKPLREPAILGLGLHLSRLGLRSGLSIAPKLRPMIKPIVALALASGLGPVFGFGSNISLGLFGQCNYKRAVQGYIPITCIAYN